jgi:hypothetical protein
VKRIVGLKILCRHKSLGLYTFGSTMLAAGRATQKLLTMPVARIARLAVPSGRRLVRTITTQCE